MIGYHFFLIVRKIKFIFNHFFIYLEETPEQPASINIDTIFDATIYNDPDKKLDK